MNTPILDIETLDTAQPLNEIFQPFGSTVEKWQMRIASLRVTRLDQTKEMALAREARLELKDARVSMDKTRKKLTEHLKTRTGAIDGAARVIRERMEQMESELLESEQFAERHAAKLKAETKALRESELAPLLDSPIVVDLSNLTLSEWEATLNAAKAARQAKIEAAAKLEAESKARVEADRIERDRIRVENEKLRAEAAIRDEEARKERLRLQALAEVERQKVAALQREIEDRECAAAQESATEQRRIEAEQAASIRASQASDGHKLIQLADTIKAIKVPDFRNPKLTQHVCTQLFHFERWCREEAEKKTISS